MMQKGRILSLDGWRVISVALVVISHLANASSLRDDFRWLGPLHNVGYCGVFIFFSISGYVITHGLLSEVGESGSFSIPQFYVRRVLRILPPLLLYLVFVVVMERFGMADVPGFAPLRAITFTCNFGAPVGADCGWSLGHTWTLAYEEQFYLLFPAMMWVVARARKPSYLLAVHAALTSALVAAYYLRTADLASFIRPFTFITAGAAAATLHDSRASIRIGTAASILAFITFLVIEALPTTSVVTLARVCLSPFLACSFLFYTRRDCALNQGLSTVPMVAIGQATYTVYLWQQMATAPYPIGPMGYTLLMCIVVTASLLSFRYLETPLIRLGRRVRIFRDSRRGGLVIVPALPPLMMAAPVVAPDEGNSPGDSRTC